MMEDNKDSVIDEEDILKLYKKLSIDMRMPLDINQIGREYQESFASLEREDYCTFAFVDIPKYNKQVTL